MVRAPRNHDALGSCAADSASGRTYAVRSATGRDRPNSSATQIAGEGERMLVESLNIATPYDGRGEQRVELRALGSRLITRYLEAVALAPIGDGSIEFSVRDPVRSEVEALKQLTWFYVIERPSLAVLQHGRRTIIQSLFDWHLCAAESRADWRLFPTVFQERLEDAERDDGSLCRLVIDRIAGLTEGAAQEIFRRMSGAEPGSVLDAAARMT
jgi:dGTPase